MPKKLPKIKETIRTITQEQVHLEILPEHICEYLATKGHPVLPADAKITVRVPGGGDWSNTNLDIDAGCPLLVSYQKTTDSADHVDEE